MAKPPPPAGAVPSDGTMADILAAAGFDPAAGPGLRAYLDLLLTWNKSMNLVGKSGWREVVDDLLLDSFHLARFLETLPWDEDPVSLDLGAGAGLPGIPLRLVWRPGRYHLVEVRQKRQSFLAMALGRLAEHGVVRTELFAGTAEAALARFSPVSMVLSRAFKPWPEVLALVEPFAPGRVAFLMNEPPPADLPAGWRVEGSLAYASPLSGASASRFVWSLRSGEASLGTPVSISR